MKQLILLSTLTIALTTSALAQTSCDTASIYSDTVNTAVCFDTIDNVLRCFSNGIPDHSDNYNQPFFSIEAKEYDFSVCAYPDTAVHFTPLYETTETQVGCTYDYVFGIAINGIQFSPNSDVLWQDSSGANNLSWHVEATSTSNSIGANMGTQNKGHINGQGAYHYHGAPSDYFANQLGIDGSAHSPIVGFAADGFPVYYKYVYASPMDSTSGIVGLSSGFTLKSGMRPGDGVLTGPDGTYDGNYVEDYEYALSDLDSCNGRFGVTPQHPYGTYYYVLTDNFPYIPRCFKGTVLDATFRSGPSAACGASTASTDCSAAVAGCMDPFAQNYNPNANIDDGSCQYPGCTGCNQVTGLREFNKQHTSMRLAWDTVCGATKYKIRWKVAGAGSWNVEYKYTNVGTAVLQGLTPNTTYWWTVKADCGTNGWGNAADVQAVTTLAHPCTKPNNLSASAVSTNQARLNWSKKMNVIKYRIRWREQGTSTWNVVAKDSAWTKHWLTGLTAGTTYQWQIRSVCEYGNATGTAWSMMQTFTTATSKTQHNFIDQAAASELINVFPNPNQGAFVLTLEGLDTPVDVRVTDLAGRTVFTAAQVANTNLQIDVGKHTKGLYFLQVSGPTVQFVQRVVVQ